MKRRDLVRVVKVSQNRLFMIRYVPAVQPQSHLSRHIKIVTRLRPSQTPAHIKRLYRK
jgi:hypothetical protein